VFEDRGCTIPRTPVPVKNARNPENTASAQFVNVSSLSQHRPALWIFSLWAKATKVPTGPERWENACKSQRASKLGAAAERKNIQGTRRSSEAFAHSSRTIAGYITSSEQATLMESWEFSLRERPKSNLLASCTLGSYCSRGIRSLREWQRKDGS
jgi:hypothetical protein